MVINKTCTRLIYMITITISILWLYNTYDNYLLIKSNTNNNIITNNNNSNIS
jgi:hypothetical protein